MNVVWKSNLSLSLLYIEYNGHKQTMLNTLVCKPMSDDHNLTRNNNNIHPVSAEKTNPWRYISLSYSKCNWLDCRNGSSIKLKKTCAWKLQLYYIPSHIGLPHSHKSVIINAAGISPFHSDIYRAIIFTDVLNNKHNFSWKSMAYNKRRKYNKMVLGTHNRSVSNGILLGTCVNSRCEQSTVCPEHVQIRGHFNISLAP